MDSTSRVELTHLLYQALGESIGLLIQASDCQRVRQRLYAARTASGDESLRGLQIRQWNAPEGEEGNLVIVNSRILAGRS